jgi:hypothetical protein
MKKPISNPVKTTLTISVGLIVVYLITKKQWVLSVSFVVGLIGIFSDFLSQKIDFVWMKISWLLSLIVPNIVLSLIFYLLLFPISLLAKLFGEKDTLRLKNNSKTNFIDFKGSFDKSSFERTW